MNKIILTSILAFTLFACSDNKELSSMQQAVINNAINYIKKNNEVKMKDCYLVDSRLSLMQFELFFNTEKANFEQKFGENYQEILKNIENDLNSKGINEYNDFYTKFSSCSESKYVINFSRMSETYVMCYLSQESKSISINEILKKKYKFNSNEYYFFLFEFNNLGEIENIFKNSVIFN